MRLRYVLLFFLLLTAGCVSGYVRYDIKDLPRLKAHAILCSPADGEPGYIRVSIYTDDLHPIPEQVLASCEDWVLCGEDVRVWLAIASVKEKSAEGGLEFVARWLPQGGFERPHLMRVTTEVKDYCVEIVNYVEGQREELQQLWADLFTSKASAFYKAPLALQAHTTAVARRMGTEPPRFWVRRDMPETPGPFAMISGDAAIQQALMTNLMRERVKPSKQVVEISTLEPMKLKEHGWSELIGERKADIPAASRVCPADTFFVNFRDMNRALQFFEFVSDWGTSPLRLAALQRGEMPARDRVMRLLALRTRWYHKYFYSSYIRSLTLLLGDFYLRQMPDLAIIFEPQPGELDSVAALLLDSLKDAAEESELQVNKTRIAGIEVEYVEAPESRICAYHAVVEGFVVRASNPGLMRHIIETAKGHAPRLSDAPDFHYVLVTHPYSAQGYAFISDAFVKRLVSPLFKVAELRRTNCAGNMAVLESAALAFKTERARPPHNPEELVKHGFLTSVPVCPDGGNYAFSPDGHLHCSVHRTRSHLTPLWELPVQKVTKEEAERYRTFCKGYQEYWRKYFDPTGISITVSGDEVALDVFITPLAEGYRLILGYIAGKGEGAVEVGELVMAGFVALGRLKTLDFDTHTEDFHNELAEWLELDKPVLGWLESAALVIAHDDDWQTWLRRVLSLSDYRWPEEHPEEAGRFISSLPVALVLRVNDAKAAERFLRRFYDKIKEEAQTEEASRFSEIGRAFDAMLLEEKEGRLLLRLRPAEADFPIEICVMLEGQRIFVSPNLPLIEELSKRKEMSETTRLALGTKGRWQIGVMFDIERMSGTLEALKRVLVSRAAVVCENERAQTQAALWYYILSEPEKVFRVRGEDLVRMGLLDIEPGCPDGGDLLFEAARVRCTRHDDDRYEKMFPHNRESLEKASGEEKELLLEPVHMPRNSRLLRLIKRIASISIALEVHEDYMSTRIRFGLR